MRRHRNTSARPHTQVPPTNRTVPGLVHTFLIGRVAGMPKEYDAETKAKAVRLVQDHRRGLCLGV